jgi:hypothetical protein
MTEYIIRRAGSDDIPALRAMQARSLRGLGATHYGAAAIEAFLRHADTLEAAVVEEGHAFLAEDRRGPTPRGGGRRRSAASSSTPPRRAAASARR